MKRIKLYMITFALMTAGFTQTSCDDDFMNEVPRTAITVPGYFNTVGDLETYSNEFYKDIMPWGGIRDANSDNVTGPGHTEGAELWMVVNGLLSKSNVGGWGDWEKLRTVNVLLDNADRVQGAEADINHWKAFGHYCRAILYINMVQRYSDVPWIEHAIDSNDPDVYRPSDPRAFVVENIMKDLEYAGKWLKPDIGNRTRIHKYCALTLLSRFALYEGTYRKYHAELSLQSTANDFLNRAVTASEEIMNSGYFEVSDIPSVDEPSTGIKGSPTYRNLFASYDLKDNKEIIRWIEFKSVEDPSYGSNNINSYHYGLSRSLMESYLTFDGKPFSEVAGYETLPYYTGFANRDPRLAENITHPGSILYKTPLTPYRNHPVKGGYCQEKFEANGLIARQYEGRLVYRYAEVLLNYAEAKAELGQFSEPEANKSINKLRKRVGMPDFDANREVDQTLRNQYPNVSDPVILAVRRERRVELASEGLRLQDIYRWCVGERLLDPEARQGMYIPSFGSYDSSGDGIPDYAIYENESDIPADWASYNGMLWYYMKDDLPAETRGEHATTIEISNGTYGYILNKETNARGFRSPKDYYRPINVTHTVLNPGIKQPFGWDN